MTCLVCQRSWWYACLWFAQALPKKSRRPFIGAMDAFWWSCLEPARVAFWRGFHADRWRMCRRARLLRQTGRWEVDA